MKNTILLVLVSVLALSTKVTNADFTFGEPVNLGPTVNTSYGEHGVCISSNGLEFYFMSDRPGGYGGYDLWVMKRATIQDDWGSPENAGSPANTRYCYWEPTISVDCLTLYFSDGHLPPFGNHLPGGLGGDGDIWMLSRETVDGTWGPPINIGPTINSQHAVSPSLSADGLSLYFQSHRPGRLGGHCDIMVATRESTSDTFGAPAFLENVNTTGPEWMPDISADGLTLIFCRNYATELWMATRVTIYDDFDTPVRLPPWINIPSYTNASPTFSADGTILYFGSDRPAGFGSYDLWLAPIIPAVDFNSDEIIDLDDLVMLIENWGTNDTLYDIGPMPWGDGVVDVEDLKVFITHWEEENMPNPEDAEWTRPRGALASGPA
jgi:hypothetical protein